MAGLAATQRKMLAGAVAFWTWQSSPVLESLTRFLFPKTVPAIVGDVLVLFAALRDALRRLDSR